MSLIYKTTKRYQLDNVFTVYQNLCEAHAKQGFTGDIVITLNKDMFYRYVDYLNSKMKYDPIYQHGFYHNVITQDLILNTSSGMTLIFRLEGSQPSASSETKTEAIATTTAPELPKVEDPLSPTLTWDK